MAFTLVSDSVMISGDTSNSKPAVVLKGGDTDDGISLHTTAAAATAANHTSGTFAAWVMPGDITSTMAIISVNDTDVVEYIDFKIVAGKLTAACVDATTAQWTVGTDAVTCPKHVWTHVALVHDGTAPTLFVNGVRPAQTMSVTTAPSTFWAALDGVDKGWVGISSIGGAGATTEEFVGAINNPKYWASALTADQIALEYSGVNQGTPYFWHRMENLDLINSGSEGTAFTLVSDAYLTPTYNEFMSRLRYMITTQGTIVTGDIVGFSDVNGKGSALIVNVA